MSPMLSVIKTGSGNTCTIPLTVLAGKYNKIAKDTVLPSQLFPHCYAKVPLASSDSETNNITLLARPRWTIWEARGLWTKVYFAHILSLFVERDDERSILDVC